MPAPHQAPAFPSEYAEAPRYLALGNVAVSPKISKTEANQKLITYMALGMPTIVFESPVNREILGDLGVYAKIGDVGSLAEALIGLLKNEEHAKKLGEESYLKAKSCYSWQAVGDQLINLYSQLGTGVPLSRQEKGYVGG